MKIHSPWPLIRLGIISCVLCLGLSVGGCATAPPPQHQATNLHAGDAKPHPHSVWVKGHYTYRHGRYVWVPGHWRQR